MENQPSSEPEQSYAKEQLGVKKGETRLLGLTWDKTKDTIGVTFPAQPAEPTKRGILGKIAKCYDPLGLVSPVTLAGKVLYRGACDLRTGWDKLYFQVTCKQSGSTGNGNYPQKSKYQEA